MFAIKFEFQLCLWRIVCERFEFHPSDHKFITRIITKEQAIIIIKYVDSKSILMKHILACNNFGRHNLETCIENRVTHIISQQ